MKKFEKMREKGNSNNPKFSFCIYICKQSILLVLYNFKCCYVVIVLPNCLIKNYILHRPLFILNIIAHIY